MLWFTLNILYLWHSSFSAWTIRVSNPIRYPCLRPSTSVITQRTVFTFVSLESIKKFHLYSFNTKFTSHIKLQYITINFYIKLLSIKIPFLKDAYTVQVPFKPNKDEKRQSPLSYRDCWHKIQSRPMDIKLSLSALSRTL